MSGSRMLTVGFVAVFMGMTGCSDDQKNTDSGGSNGQKTSQQQPSTTSQEPEPVDMSFPTDKDPPILPEAAAQTAISGVGDKNRFMVKLFEDRIPTAQPTSNQVIAQATWSGYTLELVSGDITKEAGATDKVSIIQNAANGSLAGGGGVDGAIKKAAGDTPYAPNGDAGVYLKGQNKTSVPTGSVVMTVSGNLKSQQVDYIAHTVGPNCGSGDEHEKNLMIASKGVLVKSDKMGERHKKEVHVSQVPVSAGIFGCPVEKTAEIQMQVAVAHMDKGEGRVKTVRLVVMDVGGEQKTLKSYVKVFKSLFK
ncbi:MAG: macro domain-containing protein [Myxococcota bacterium]